MGDMGLQGAFGTDALFQLLAQRKAEQAAMAQRAIENDREQQKLDIMRTQATAKETPKPVTLGPGQHLFDPTGTELASVPSAPERPMSMGPGASLVDPSSGRILTTTPAAPPRPMSVAPGASLMDPTSGRILSTAPDRTPKEPTPHFGFLQTFGPDGKPGSVLRTNTLTGEATPTDIAAIKPPPGAAQEAQREASKKEALGSLDQLDQAITAAQSVIGPGAGRVSRIEQLVGNPDPRVSALGTKLLLTKMQVDHAASGTVRAGASPQLLSRWDNLLSQNLNPENLHASVQAMREILGGNAGSGSGAKRIRYDMNGNPIKD